MRTHLTKGQQVHILPEWQDAGDNELHFVTTEDEDGGRVAIMATNTGLAIPGVQVVDVKMLVEGQES